MNIRSSLSPLLQLPDEEVTWETLRDWFDRCKRAGHKPAFQVICDAQPVTFWNELPRYFPSPPQFWAFVDNEAIACGYLTIPLPQGTKEDGEEKSEEIDEDDENWTEFGWSDKDW